MLGNIGTVELFVIMVTILLVFGAKRIPEIARALGSGIREFREAGRAISNELRMEDDLLSNRSPKPGRHTGSEARADRRSTVGRTESPHDEIVDPSVTNRPPAMPEASEDAGIISS